MTGNYYAQARYYDAEVGRFVSRDKERFIYIYNSKTENLYSYSENRPLNYIDPTGNIIYTPLEGTEAHLIIEEYACETLGAYTEYRIDGASFCGTGLFGRADIILVNGLDAEVYEIKPVTYANGSRRALAMIQIETYVNAINNDAYDNKLRLGVEGAIPGISYDCSFENMYAPSVVHPGMYIQYYADGDGLILYRYVEKEKIPDNYQQIVMSEELESKLEKRVKQVKFATVLIQALVAWNRINTASDASSTYAGQDLLYCEDGEYTYTYELHNTPTQDFLDSFFLGLPMDGMMPVPVL